MALTLPKFQQDGTGAVNRDFTDKLKEVVSVKDFGAVGDGFEDDTDAIQAAIDSAWMSGKTLLLPAGTYRISATLNIPPGDGYEYRADSFSIIGEGATSVFLSYILGHGTTIVTNADVPILTYTDHLSNGNNLHIAKIRFQQENGSATNPVLYFETMTTWSTITDCQIYQAGTGNGITIDYAWGCSISNTFVANKDLVTTPGTRVGTGMSISTGAGAGGLLKLDRVTSRGFLNGFSVGYLSGTTNMSARIEQCQTSYVTNGILINSGMRKAVVDNCYFEGNTGKCITDNGMGTTVSNCFFFEGYTIGIDSTASTYGNTYIANEFQLNTANSTSIAVYSQGDAPGYKKVIEGNYIYFIGSGGSLANVVGVAITGANPCVDIINNTFRPRRAWVGGSGTTKILDSSTGYNTGTVPLTDTLNEVPYLSNVSLGFIPHASNLTEANVSGGVLNLSAASWNIVQATVATNITQLNDGFKNNRIIVITNNNTNATFVKGTYMIMASNFSGYGTIVFQLRVIAGQTYAYELSRTVY